jgi:hypothetical protein
VLVDDSTELGVQILAKDTGSNLKLRNKDGRETVVLVRNAIGRHSRASDDEGDLGAAEDFH